MSAAFLISIILPPIIKLPVPVSLIIEFPPLAVEWYIFKSSESPKNALDSSPKYTCDPIPTVPPIDIVLPTDIWSLKFPWVLVIVATVPTNVPLNVVAVIIPEAYMFPSEPIPTPLLNPSWGSLPTWKSLLLLAPVVATPTLPVDLAIETTLNPLSSSW